jgi:putative RNA 2'-phosphotransferase
MTDKERTRISKFLSLVLRHEPERIGHTLDNAGWAAVDDLIPNGVWLVDHVPAEFIQFGC